MTDPYDAVVLVSFGGPDGPEDVLPFLENVTRGRDIPRPRLLAVAEHYHHFGGASPINAENRLLLASIRQDFADHGLELPVYWGNRNWHPYLADTVRSMAGDGVRKALAFVTSAYSSYSGCRQYQEDIEQARLAAGPEAPRIDKLRHYFNHPGFVDANADAVRAALATLPEAHRASTRLLFTAHSIPLSMARNSGPDGDLYVRQLQETAALVAAAAAPDLGWDLAWQSRSGSPRTPWLEPDINDRLEELAGSGTTDVVVSPIGFVSDHLEVAWDLDTEAAATAHRLGVGFVRAATAGRDRRFVAIVRQLVLERTATEDLRQVCGEMGPGPDHCPAGCCLATDQAYPVVGVSPHPPREPHHA
ncbi:MAG: ferrochelatase [Mycobacteriales bacterium]